MGTSFVVSPNAMELVVRSSTEQAMLRNASKDSQPQCSVKRLCDGFRHRFPDVLDNDCPSKKNKRKWSFDKMLLAFEQHNKKANVYQARDGPDQTATVQIHARPPLERVHAVLDPRSLRDAYSRVATQQDIDFLQQCLNGRGVQSSEAPLPDDQRPRIWQFSTETARNDAVRKGYVECNIIFSPNASSMGCPAVNPTSNCAPEVESRQIATTFPAITQNECYLEQVVTWFEQGFVNTAGQKFAALMWYEDCVSLEARLKASWRALRDKHAKGYLYALYAKETNKTHTPLSQAAALDHYKMTSDQIKDFIKTQLGESAPPTIFQPANKMAYKRTHGDIQVAQTQPT
jgi:hypothetical protein